MQRGVSFLIDRFQPGYDRVGLLYRNATASANVRFRDTHKLQLSSSRLKSNVNGNSQSLLSGLWQTRTQ
jgi:hypothetical protein